MLSMDGMRLHPNFCKVRVGVTVGCRTNSLVEGAPLFLVLKGVNDPQKASVMFAKNLNEQEPLEAGTNELACGKQSQGCVE